MYQIEHGDRLSMGGDSVFILPDGVRGELSTGGRDHCYLLVEKKFSLKYLFGKEWCWFKVPNRQNIQYGRQTSPSCSIYSNQKLPFLAVRMHDDVITEFLHS